MRRLAPLLLFAAAPALAQHAGHDPAPPPAPAQSGHAGHDMAMDEQQIHYTAVTDPNLAGRRASGTAWQPDSAGHGGVHLGAGDWMVMAHAALNLAYDWQQGPRGGELAFVSGMAMVTARRDFGDLGSFADRGTIELRAMLSPDPLMGARGYPLHLASGETADGATPLIDRQHPHEFVMELSASYAHSFGYRLGAFLYAGLPGEPAFGPPAFMHRMSILDSPEAPISHHWLDSTHIVFGVITAGIVAGDFKLDGSRFNGREPDQHRWNIETGPLDSMALRLSWNPTSNLSLQASWAHLVSPEQLEPDQNSTRWSASAIYTRRWHDARDWWSATLAWGRRDGDDAFVLESAAGLGLWTIFGRAELTENDELVFAGGHRGPRFTVGKVSLGAIRDFRLGEHVRLGIGGLYAMNFVPAPLEALYSGDPDGAMVFIRLRVD